MSRISGVELKRCWGTSRIHQERGALKRGGFQAPHLTMIRDKKCLII